MVECSGAVCACGINCCEQCRMRAESILNATRGYSPECVAACIEAVKAESRFQGPHDCLREAECMRCDELACECVAAMDRAISLLPKE